MVSQTNELNNRPAQRNVPALQGDSDDPGVIRHQIKATRVQLGQTIEQIQERLSPERLKAQTKETIREATIGKVEEMTNKAEREMKSWRRRITHTVKENPVPAALIGIGVGWLMISNSENDDYDSEYSYRSNINRYQDPYDDSSHRSMRSRSGEGRTWVGERAQEVREDVGSAAERAKEYTSSVAESVQESTSETLEQAERRVTEIGDQLRETAVDAKERVQETAAQLEARAQRGMRRTKQTFIETMEENPLALGAAALAIGALVGASLPSTRYENRLMGEKRDEMFDEAKERLQETSQKVQNVAREAKDAAVDTAKEEADKQNLRPQAKLGSTASTTGQSTSTTSVSTATTATEQKNNPQHRPNS